MLSAEVRGLQELLARLKQVDNGPKLSVALAPAQPAVIDLVERESRQRAQSRQMRRAEASNRYKANKASASVTIGGGGGDREWAVGAQFGSQRYRQFPPKRGTDGYTVVPAAKDNRDKIAELYAEAVTRIFP